MYTLDSRIYWIWLQQAIGCGNPMSGPLLKAFGSAQALYEAREEELTALPMQRSIMLRLCEKDTAAAQAIFERSMQSGGWLLTPADAAYPELLRGIFAPPLVLYGRGDLPEFAHHPVIAVIGTRYPSPYGRSITAKLAAGLSSGGAIVVNGAAGGLEALAAQAVLAAGGKPVFIQACGLDIDYPKENAALRTAIVGAGGALLSEYPPGTAVGKGTFEVRNRLLSGIAHGVVVTQAASRSGTLITARWAREQGRDIFAVPGEVTSESNAGTNRLIRQGAQLVGSARDILQEYVLLFPRLLDMGSADRAFQQQDIPGSPTPKRPKGRPERKEEPPAPKRLRVAAPPPVAPPPALPEGASLSAARIFVVLSRTPTPADELAEKAGLTVSGTLAALTELEMCGCAICHAGQCYTTGGLRPMYATI